LSRLDDSRRVCHIGPADRVIRGLFFTQRRTLATVDRLAFLPPYLFSALDAAKRRRLAEGADIVDLGIGDPDQATPRVLVDTMIGALENGRNHRYPAQKGSLAFRGAVAAYMADRFGVAVDADTQVLALIGSKEGLGHLPLAFVCEGDNTLVPDLGYPVYGQATLLAGGDPRPFPLRADKGFLPDRRALESVTDARTRLVFLNYPHNPTGAVVGADFWNDMRDWAAGTGAVLVNDAAYLEVTLDGSRPVSMLAGADLAKERVIELHSLSKMFNMTGWRVGFAVGNAEVIGRLARVKESMDSGVFGAVQETAAFALGSRRQGLLAGVMGVYARRREVMLAALGKAGYEVFPGGATFYVWGKVPAGQTSMDFCRRALAEIDLVVTPGNGFGPGGEGWFRISLTAPDAAVAEGARRLEGWS